MNYGSFFIRCAEWLDRQVSPFRLCIALGIAIGCQAIMFPLDQHLHAMTGGLGKPSLVFGFVAGVLEDHLQSFGSEGRALLAQLYVIDLVFPTALAITAIQGYWLAFRRHIPKVALFLSVTAIVFDILDFIEKSVSFVVLYRFPHIPTGWLTLTVSVTSLKLVCLAVIYIGLLAAIMMRGVMRLTRR